MTKKLRMLIVAFLVLVPLLSLVLPEPVMATAIPIPDSLPQILAADAYPSCLEPGDLGVQVYYSIVYATLPSVTAGTAFTIAFVAADGITQLTSTAPYVFVNSGYTTVAGNPAGVAWLYLTAAQVTAYSINSTGVASYGIWIIGNPTITWSSTEPLTKGLLTSWGTTGTTTTQLGLKVLNYAATLGTYWSLALSQVSASGTVLTTTGEQYFQSVISNLRTICPQIFPSGAVTPVKPYISYASGFGATLTNGTGTVTGSPITLALGANTVNVTAGGTLILSLLKSTTGNVTSGTSAVTGSPVAIVAGTSTVVVTGVGNISVSLTVTNTQSKLWSPIAGTVFDMTPLANKLGMSVAFLSGIVWLVVTIIICAFVYGGIRDPYNPMDDKSGKVVMLIFDICLIGGAVVGLLPLLVAILMFVGCAFLTGYILFFRSSGA